MNFLIPKTTTTSVVVTQNANTNRVSRFMFKNDQQQRGAGFSIDPTRVNQTPVRFTSSTRSQEVSVMPIIRMA
jgi:hypothetical protein